MAGRGGGYVKYDGQLVPRNVVLEHIGELGEPDLHVSFEMRGDVPVCKEVRITSEAGLVGVRSRHLRAVTLDTLIPQAFSAHALHVVSEEGAPMTQADMPLRQKDRLDARRAVDRRLHGRVQKFGLDRVAEIYRQHEHGVVAVAEGMGLTRRTAERRIADARKAGLLPPTTPGKRKV